jgi:hypothetical protein
MVPDPQALRDLTILPTAASFAAGDIVASTEFPSIAVPPIIPVCVSSPLGV